MTAAALLPANAFDWPRMEKFVFSRPPDPARNTPGVLINRSWVSRMEDWRSISPLNAVTDTGVDWMFSAVRRAVTTMSSMTALLVTGAGSVLPVCECAVAASGRNMLAQDRESAVEGKRVSVRVDLGGWRFIEKKK